MNVKPACDACLVRWAETEILSMAKRGGQMPQEWNVDLDDLRASAADGCPICKIHLSVLRTVDGSSNVVVSHLALEKEESENKETADLTRLMISGKPYDLFTYNDDPAAQYVSNRPSKPDKLGDASLSTVQNWFTECLNRHRFACHEPLTPVLPSRIIQVSRDPDSSFQARLVESAGVSGRYAALSYCWGPEKYNLKTTVANYDQHLNGLPMDRLPHTIRDAIITTGRLGLQYLWVDAICIIQDSDTDKALQITNMLSIYDIASITIVAASAPHASYGFLSMPSEPRKAVFKLPYHPTGTVYAALGETKAQHLNKPIHLRAWTLQERLLSRRKLYFFEDRIAWECKSRALFHSGEFLEMDDDVRMGAISEGTYTSSCKYSTKLWLIHPDWTKCVEWYTQRTMTKSSDKFIAIGGIAEEFGKVLDVKYLAGLWDGFILPGLLWRRVINLDGDILQPRPVDYRAPSWSWAAIDGKIEYVDPDREKGSLEVARFSHTKSIAEITRPAILNTFVKLASPHTPFGAVIAGHILLDGMNKLVKGEVRESLESETGKTLKMTLGTSQREQQSGGAAGSLTIWSDADDVLLTGKGELCLLALTGCAEDTWSHQGDPRGSVFIVRGIVTTEHGHDEAKRAGFFELSDPDYVRLMEGWSRQELKMV